MTILYTLVRVIVELIFWGWFREVRVLGQENVPFRKPVVLAATHCNMIVDPLILALTIPFSRMVHFWGKNSLFANPVAAAILHALGVIPVDRSTKDNAKLFSSSFDCLDEGEVMAIFPEGTSYTLPHIMELKDGASWITLQHYERILTRLAKEKAPAGTGTPATLIPVGITYVNKQQWRSVVIVQYGTPIDLDPFIELFDKEGMRTAVKSLTKEIDRCLRSITVNAPDWDIFDRANMTRMLVAPTEEIAPEDYVPLTQSMVNLLTESEGRPDVQQLAADIQRYTALLEDGISIADEDIAAFMQRDVGPIGVTVRLAVRAVRLLLELPLFLPGVLFHLPIYWVTKTIERKERYEECKAQNKIGVSVVLLPIQYALLFWLGWGFLGRNLLGFFIAITLTATFVIYHVTLVDERYEMLKGLGTAWRMWQSVCLSGDSAEAESRRVGMAVDLRRDVTGQLHRILRRYKGESSAVAYVEQWRKRHLAAGSM